MFGDITKEFEGFSGSIYKDTKGNPTVGYGFNLKDKRIATLIPKDVKTGKREMTQDEADGIFTKLYYTAQRDAVKFIGMDTFNRLNPEAKDTIFDMSYNLGANKLSGFQRFKKAMQKGNFTKAAAELKDSDWWGQVGRRSRYHFDVIKNASFHIPWDEIIKGATNGSK